MSSTPLVYIENYKLHNEYKYHVQSKRLRGREQDITNLQLHALLQKSFKTTLKEFILTIILNL